VIAGLDALHCTKFRNNLEFWRTADRVLLGAGEIAGAAQQGVEPAVRIRFEGAYDPDNDEFVTKTWFAIPRLDDGTPLSECRSDDKREFGFLHLRALRTGSRALSMERGSLLDVILKTYEIRTQMWEGLLERLRHLDVVGENDAEFGVILTAIRDAMREIVPGGAQAAIIAFHGRPIRFLVSRPIPQSNKRSLRSPRDRSHGAGAPQDRTS
jgi:putative ATP-dependent endonuclease of OLD family